MTCRSATRLRLAGTLSAGGGCLPGGTTGLCRRRLLVAAPEAGDERDLLLLARGG